MKINKLKSRIIYGIFSGFVYALIIAFLDYYNDKPFNYVKFVVGLIIFGAAMAIVMRFKNDRKK